MSTSAAPPEDALGPDDRDAVVREVVQAAARFWWAFIVTGVAWLIIALVVLQFDGASARTVGVLIGLMFLLSSAQQLGLATLTRGAPRVICGVFAALLLVGGVVALASPVDTFVGIADVLGFLFLVVGVMWLVQAFADRPANDLWWLGLVAGLLMVVMAFWTAGQLLIQKEFMLLVFAGIWAMLSGATDIARAFALRGLR